MASWGYIRFHIKGESGRIKKAFEMLCASDGEAWKKESEISEKELIIRGKLKEPADIEPVLKKYPCLMIKGATVAMDRSSGSYTGFYSKNGSSGIIFEKTLPLSENVSSVIGDYSWWAEEKEIYEEISPKELILAKFNGGESEFEIPEEVNGKKVTGIKRNAFSGNEYIRYITVHESVKKIGAAFSGCTRLTVICDKDSAAEKYCTRKNIPFLYKTDLPENALKKAVFNYTRDGIGIRITGMKFNSPELNIPEKIDSAGVYSIGGFSECEGLISAVIPEGVRETEENAFHGCRSLERVTLPESLEKIGAGAFYGCEGLKEINIPPKIKEIPANAFCGCKKISCITLPKGVTAIESGAFSGCTSLSEVIFPSGKIFVRLTAFDGTPFLEGLIKAGKGFAVINGTLFKYEGNEEEISLPEGISETGASAFRGNTALKKVVVPEGVTRLGKFSFSGCRSLSRIILPSTLSAIDEFAFYGCTGLKEITFPEGVCEIGKGAFSECASLEKITLPAGLRFLGREVFEGCKMLSSLTVPENSGTVYLYDLLSCESLRELYISRGVSINTDEFAEILSRTGNAPFRLDIDRYFTPVINFKKLPAGMKPVFCIYFLTCAEMYGEEEKKPYISYIKRNKDMLFSALTETGLINALWGFLSLDLLTAAETDRYTEISRKGNKEEISALLMEYKHKRFTAEEIEKETERSIKREFSADPFSVKEMGRKWQWKKLPDGTLLLKSYTGTETEIIIPSRIGRTPVSALGDDVFNPWQDKINNPGERKKIISVTIAEGISEIGSRAFSGCCSLECVRLPKSLKKIGEKAFFRCTALERITLPEGLTEISGNMFYRCKSLKELALPKNITRIGNSAFYECTGLQTVNIPDSVSVIEEFAFSGCSGLEKITFGSGVREICRCAFSDCVTVGKINFPAGIKAIRELAFSGCTSLEKINIPDCDSLEGIEKNAFKGCRLTVNS